MIVCAATLLFVLMAFAPIRIRVYAQVFPKNFQANICATVLGVTVFSEKAKFEGVNVKCNGTVDADLNIAQMDTRSGRSLLKCVTVDKVFVSFQNNLSDISVRTLLAENIVCALTTIIACGSTNCQVSSNVLSCLDESRICAKLAVSVNVAELSFCLLKQGVQLWMRKSVKS